MLSSPYYAKNYVSIIDTSLVWNGVTIYLYNCLQFGLRSASKLFNVMAQLLSWIARSRGMCFSIHYLDDYLNVGLVSSLTCRRNLDIFKATCRELGVPLALEIVEGLKICLTFLRHAQIGNLST